MNDQFLAWADWAQTTYKSGVLPLSGSDDTSLPWSQNRWDWLERLASSSPERVRSELKDALSHLSLTRDFDPVSRFVGLNSLYQLWGFAENELYGEHLGDWERSDRYPTLEDCISWLRAQLTEYVEALPIARIPDEWNRLAWEVSASSLAAAFDRARSLLDRAAAHGLLPRERFRQLRGRLLFLAAYSPPDSWNASDACLAGVHWLPGLPGQTELERFVGSIFVLDSLEAPLALEPCSQESLTLYRDAAADLEFLHPSKDKHGHWEECAMLARCQYALQRFIDAAREYEAAATATDFGDDAGKARVKILWAAEHAYENGGRYADAERIANLLAELQPDDRETRMAVARLRARDNDYVGAYHVIEEFVTNETPLPDDWLLSTIKGLGALAADPEQRRRLRGFIDSQQRLKAGVLELTLHYWPEFEALPTAVKDCWVVGDVAAHFLGVSTDLRPELVAVACGQYATAVERLFEAVVFTEYRKQAERRSQVMTDARLSERCARGSGAKELSGYLLRTRDVSLGDIGVVLRHAGTSREQLLKDFAVWLRENHFALCERAGEIKPLVDARNPAVHRNQPPASLAAVRSQARRFLEAAIKDMVRRK